MLRDKERPLNSLSPGIALETYIPDLERDILPLQVTIRPQHKPLGPACLRFELCVDVREPIWHLRRKCTRSPNNMYIISWWTLITIERAHGTLQPHLLLNWSVEQVDIPTAAPASILPLKIILVEVAKYTGHQHLHPLAPENHEVCIQCGL